MANLLRSGMLRGCCPGSTSELHKGTLRSERNTPGKSMKMKCGHVDTEFSSMHTNKLYQQIIQMNTYCGNERNKFGREIRKRI